MKTRKLTYFDLFTLNMVIKGAWIYRELPETPALQASLNKCLKPYPWLLGHYEEKQKSVVWSGNETSIRLTEIDGTGLPLRAQQAMLPDMIKFWQPKADGPVQIIYGGWASKIMRRK